MSQSDPTISAREMRYRKRQAERGMKMVRVWCPAEKVNELKAFAEKLRANSQTPDQA